MADALTKINFPPSRPCCSSSHHPHPPKYGLKSLDSSSNSQRLSLKLPSTLRPISSTDFYARRIELGDAKGISRISVSPPRSSTVSHVGTFNGFLTPKAQKWWEKRLQPNMKEVTSAHALVDSLLNAGDKLVIVVFFSPGCGACKALHPKICQFSEMNPNVQFLQVNHEEHKSMCYSLGVHVLPFFRFYRGAHGRLCSFSCTNATIKKFKDALAKHNTDRCSLGPTQGLEEKDLVALAANKELSFNYTSNPAKEALNSIPAHVGGVEISEPERSRPVLEQLPLPVPSNILKSVQTSKENTYVG